MPLLSSPSGIGRLIYGIGSSRYPRKSMNLYLLIAGCLAFTLGLIHSVLGEILIFRQLLQTNLASSSGRAVLKERHIRTLRSTWHIVTLFGWGFGTILFCFALSSTASDQITATKNIMVAMFLVAAAFWLIGTKGKHPAWVVLAIIAVFVWLA